MSILSPMFILLIVVLIVAYWLIAFYQPKSRIKIREDYIRANKERIREAIEYKELNKQCDRTIKMLQEMIDRLDRLEKDK